MFSESGFREKQSEPMACTITGEPYQPVRLYYEIRQKKALLGRFKRLKCIDYEGSSKRWVWLYDEEAKNLKFTKSYREIPKEYRPIILGYLTVKSEAELLVDVRSFKRAIEAILFFDKKINRRLAKVEKIRVVNKLFTVKETEAGMSKHHSQYFEQTEVIEVAKKREEIEKKVEEWKELDQQERQEALFSLLETQMSEKLPLVEELETNFYEDGIEGLEMALRMREVEAIEHWKGNKNFNQFDFIQRMLKQ